jgi:hypothetical protein
MFAILGSGFGLYGYLPALVSGCGQQVVLPERYRSRFHERPELARFLSGISWARDEASAVEGCSGVALVLRPADQEVWLERCLARADLKYLLLEKPLARNPESAQRALDMLIGSGKAFRIGYVFRLTSWGCRLLSVLGAEPYQGKLSIQWNFNAHHYQHDLNNWKRFVTTGGGVIRFFGIHILALLAEIGYRNIVMSTTSGASLDEIDRWSAVVSGVGLPECNIVVDSRSSAASFQVVCVSGTNGRLDVSERLATPFDADQPLDAGSLTGLDPRVSLLIELCRSLLAVAENEYDWYQHTLELWRSAEEKAYLEPLAAETRRGITEAGSS